MSAERRKNDRYPVHDRTFAMLKFSDTLGIVRNMSETGLLFEHLGDEGCLKGWLAALFEKVDVFNSGRDFRMENVPCRIVHHGPVEGGASIMTSGPVYQCGVCFKRLKKCDNASLCSFIEDCRCILEDAM